ncbi:MAG: lysine decarboxylase, partial [Terriglobales bacterium]
MNDGKPRSSRQPLLAYEDRGFLNSPDARLLRMMAEYQEPLARFRRHNIQDTVVFFGSARITSREEATARVEALEKPGGAAPSPSPAEQLKVARKALE